MFECIICPDGDICPARSVGLVHYPATLAPDDGTDDVAVYCADNAHITSSAQTVTCTANGDYGVEICQG